MLLALKEISFMQACRFLLIEAHILFTLFSDQILADVFIQINNQFFPRYTGFYLPIINVGTSFLFTFKKQTWPHFSRT